MSTDEHRIVRLREVMERRGLSAADLAEQIGVSQSRLSNALSGRAPFRETRLRAIATMVGVSPEWLLDGEGEMARVAESSARTLNEMELLAIWRELAEPHRQALIATASALHPHAADHPQPPAVPPKPKPR